MEQLTLDQLHNVQLQNVQLQNLHLPNVQLQNVQVTKRPGYKTSILQKVQITKRPGHKMSSFCKFKNLFKKAFFTKCIETPWMDRIKQDPRQLSACPLGTDD